MAYNFNPREKPYRQKRFEEYQKQGFVTWSMIPIGQHKTNSKYQTDCGSVYQSYNDCLRATLFDRDKCLNAEKAVIVCQKQKGLYRMDEKLAILKSYKKKKSANPDTSISAQMDDNPVQ